MGRVQQQQCRQVASCRIKMRVTAQTTQSISIYKVYLDGVEVKLVYEFDTKEGWVKCYDVDSNGRFIKNGLFDGFKTIKRHGKITYKTKDQNERNS